MARRRSSSNPKWFKPRIFWVPTHLAYALKTPYIERWKDFLNEMKMSCSIMPQFEPNAKVWLIQEPDIAQVRGTVDTFYGSHDFEEKPPDGGPQMVMSNGVSDDYKTLIQAAGLELATELYRKTIRRVHPDAGGSNELCAAVNVAWRNIKSSLT